jgi:hypothetical protein
MDPAAKATFADAARGWDEFARCWRELQRQPAPGAVHLDCTRRAGVLAALTLFVWLRRHPEFAREYRSAKWFQCHCLADDLVDIADNCNPENFRLAKRRIAELASRLSKPKKYR